MSSLRSPGAGAASGAWFGLLIGLLLGVFTPVAGWIVLLVAGLVFGALWGAFFGFVAYLVTRGRRDFASVKHLAAGQYEVLVESPYAARAAELLSRQPS